MSDDLVDVTIVGYGDHKRAGIRVFQTAQIDRRDVRTLGPIRLTSPARTLLDVAALVPMSKLEKAVANSEARRLVSRSDLFAQVVKNPGRTGTRALRALLEAEGGPSLTRSEAERRLLHLIRAARLPAPETNRRIRGHEVDFLWRNQTLIVEVDGFQYHSNRRAFERDRSRDADLGSHGFEVIRITWRQLVDEPEVVIARIASALARRTPSG